MLMLLTYSIVDFDLFFDRVVDILLTRSRCKVSKTQVTIKASYFDLTLVNHVWHIGVSPYEDVFRTFVIWIWR